MGALRTLIATLALSATQAAAFPDDPHDQTQIFAGCAGRYSAVVEHARLFDGVESEEAEARRDLFLTLLEAVLPEPDLPTLSWRIDAKAAHAALLATSVFGTYPERAARARDLAQSYIKTCDALVLPV